MAEIIDNATAKAEAIVLNDLASKKLGNQPQPEGEPKSAIHEAVTNATQKLDPRDGSVI